MSVSTPEKKLVWRCRSLFTYPTPFELFGGRPIAPLLETNNSR